MKFLFPILLLFSALSGCAKKTPIQPLENISTVSPAEKPVGTSGSTGTTGNVDTVGKTGTTGSTGVTGTTVPTTDPDVLTYLALGDSYTVGESLSKDQSFPYQLTAQLNSQLKVSTPTVIATTGWTTLNLINGVNNSGLTKNTYDFVTLLIGVNDQYWTVDQDSYRAQFITMMNVAIRFAKGDKTKVFVISIPDYSVTPSQYFRTAEDIVRVAREIDEFNAINKSESIKAGVNYQDITDISRQAANDLSLLAPDKLHPSGKMYALWIQRLAPLVKSKLAK
jgi:lysophospholipase L1-like esterase